MTWEGVESWRTQVRECYRILMTRGGPERSGHIGVRLGLVTQSLLCTGACRDSVLVSPRVEAQLSTGRAETMQRRADYGQW